jgi:hypothetical protein
MVEQEWMNREKLLIIELTRLKDIPQAMSPHPEWVAGLQLRPVMLGSSFPGKSAGTEVDFWEGVAIYMEEETAESATQTGLTVLRATAQIWRRWHRNKDEHADMVDMPRIEEDWENEK